MKEASGWCGPCGSVPAKSGHRAVIFDLTGQLQKQVFLQVTGYSGDEKCTGTAPGNQVRKRTWGLSAPQPPPSFFKAGPFGLLWPLPGLWCNLCPELLQLQLPLLVLPWAVRAGSAPLLSCHRS